MNAVVGIDPGQSGGIALLTADGEPAVWKMPATERDLCDLLRSFPADTRAWLEQVHSMPKQGVTSAFTFGRGYGQIEGMLIALKIPFTRVTPGVWQRSLSCLTKGDKNVSKRRAQEWYPLIAVTHAVADALLIATYGQRQGVER